MENLNNLPEMKVITHSDLKELKGIKNGQTMIFDTKATRDSAHTIVSVLRRVNGSGLALITRKMADGRFSGQIIVDSRAK